MRLPLLTTLLLGACAPPEALTVRASHFTDQGDRSSRVGITVDDGDRSRSLARDELDVTVETRGDDGDWQPAEEVSYTVGVPRPRHVVVVADNSGSQSDFEHVVRDAVGAFGGEMLASDVDRMGLVRVSSVATVESDLTTEPQAFADAVDGLFVADGWTALYDGVRLAREVLTVGDTYVSDRGELCLHQAQHDIVVFTDGGENNSSDEQDSRFEGDGIDTTLADLLEMRIHGGTPAVHTIGVGHDVRDDDLRTLAQASGGVHRSITSYDALYQALEATTDDLDNEVPVCFAAPSCDHTEARITVATVDGVGEVIVPLPELCEEGGDPADPDGCTYGRGYWTNHPDAWPVQELTLGQASYTRAELIDLLESPARGDASLILGAQLIAAKLNVANGASAADVADVIADADDWLAEHEGRLPLGVRTNQASHAVTWGSLLDDYNNGGNGPGACEE